MNLTLVLWLFFRMIVNLTGPMFVEPTQRFTFRQQGKTVATGVVTKLLDLQTEEMKTGRARKKLMMAEVEKLGFNPYGDALEPRHKREEKKKAK